MFGLMQAKKCGMNNSEKHFRRLNYCGTCKTIGSLYSQKSRLLLNHDTVFLAEILTALSGEDTQNWQNAYQSYNCLSLPESEMPVSLQFAATTNIILTQFKLADHITDEGKRRYKYAHKTFSKEFTKAESLLKDWKFPLEEVKTLLEMQAQREREITGETPQTILKYLSAPTAETTALFFAEGAKLIGKSELEKSAYNLGYAFGKLIYLLDAYEDYEKDFREKQFNAVRSAFNLESGKIPADIKRKTISILHKFESEVSEYIYTLPIAENPKEIYTLRLSQNLQRKLKTNLPVLSTKKICMPKAKQTFAQRWQMAKDKAKSLAGNYSWQMPLVFLFIFTFALVAPAQSREAKSARECFDLSFNLMFLGTIFGSVLASPLKMVAINTKRKKKQEGEDGGDDSGGWCDSCDCCDCDCDGCCCGCGDCNCCGDGCCCDGCDCGCD